MLKRSTSAVRTIIFREANGLALRVIQIQIMQLPHRAFAVFARIVNGQLEVYETMRGSKKLTLRALMGRE